MDLFTLIAIVVVMVLVLRMTPERAGNLEQWADQHVRGWRVITIPLVLAVVPTLIGLLTNTSFMVARVFAYGFLGMILYSFAHTVSGRKKVGLLPSLFFLTVLVGSILGLIIVFSQGLTPPQ